MSTDPYIASAAMSVALPPHRFAFGTVERAFASSPERLAEFRAEVAKHGCAVEVVGGVVYIVPGHPDTTTA